MAPNAKSQYERRPMVGWYNPARLVRTGVEVVLSTIFGSHSDNRRFDALTATDSGIYDYSQPTEQDGSFWFDYAADCGDGWRSTYAVAWAHSQPTIAHGTDHLKRGGLLILGGDLVYPTPSFRQYQDRLIGPYEDALPHPPAPPRQLLVLPGNHDWYDSLKAFRRYFLSQHMYSCFTTKQTRSYFIAKLPHNWWILGVDLQLTHDLDDEQFRFFQTRLDNDIPQNANIVLCSPEPLWIKRHGHEADLNTATSIPTLYAELERAIGPRLKACIAGDLHHYRRLESQDQRRIMITCGTGGAFLHPTHVLGGVDPNGSICKRAFPDTTSSNSISKQNLLFPLRNPKFGLLYAFLYLVTSWQTGLYVGLKTDHISILEIGTTPPSFTEFSEVFIAGFHSGILSPIGGLLYLFIFAGFMFFADRSSKWFRILGGWLHAFAHILVGFLIYWLAAYWSITTLGFAPKSIPQYLTAGLIISTLGYVFGPMLFGLYLYISIRLFKKHPNEAFSSLKVDNWKGFLRGKVDSSGNLTLYYIGMRQIPKHWKAKEPDQPGPRWVPDGDQFTPPAVIDAITYSSDSTTWAESKNELVDR